MGRISQEVVTIDSPVVVPDWHPLRCILQSSASQECWWNYLKVKVKHIPSMPESLGFTSRELSSLVIPFWGNLIWFPWDLFFSPQCLLAVRTVGWTE